MASLPNMDKATSQGPWSDFHCDHTHIMFNKSAINIKVVAKKETWSEGIRGDRTRTTPAINIHPDKASLRPTLGLSNMNRLIPNAGKWIFACILSLGLCLSICLCLCLFLFLCFNLVCVSNHVFLNLGSQQQRIWGSCNMGSLQGSRRCAVFK